MSRSRPSALLLAATLLTVVPLAAEDAGRVRPPAVAGSFYPADRAQLQQTVDTLLAGAAVAPPTGPVRAIVAPHAGYAYSGAVAAHAYAILKTQKFRRVVIIAPSHYERFGFASVYEGDAYATPLGAVAVDKNFAARLAAASPLLKLSSRGHKVSGTGREHALEVQLPFLQRALGSFELVPVVMGEQSYELSRALGVALARTISAPDTLIVASSDLSHFHSYEEATALDRKPLRALLAWDYFSLSRHLAAGAWEACGGGPIVAAMIAAERLGATQAALLKYANTGDVTSDHARVVGYAAAAFVQASGKPAASAGPEYALPARDREQLLKIARQSVESAVRRRQLFEPVLQAASDSLLEERGAFVTLTRRGELRGCIGHVTALQPLYVTVRDVSVLAALRDPRFPPITSAELDELRYEISVLSAFRRVADVRQVEVGRHGLLVKRGDREGVLLPQVAAEQGWDRIRFLENACLKAGLAADAWKSEDTDVFIFTALVWAERGKVSEPPRPIQPGQAASPGSDRPPGPR